MRNNTVITKAGWDMIQQGLRRDMELAGRMYIAEPCQLTLSALCFATTHWLAARDEYDWYGDHWDWYRRWCEDYYRGWAHKLICDRFPEARAEISKF